MKLCRPLVYLAILMRLTACAWGQGAVTLKDLELGVVIEKFEDEFSGPKKAGLVEGDVLLSWSRGDSQGKLESPFDVFQMLAEEAPRGAVALEGLRGPKKQAWTLRSEYWGTKIRPNFSGVF